MSLGYKFLYAYFEAIKARLISNYGEFAIIKIGIIHFLPDTYKLQCITIMNNEAAPSDTASY